MSRIKTCVSLYSLQNEYMYKRMSLEDIFAFLHENNVDGVEILPDQMIKGAPHPSEETLAQWDSLCEKYQIKPVISDIFLNTNLYENRELTKMVNDIRVKVDGEEIPRETIRCTVDGGEYWFTLDEMKTVTTHKSLRKESKVVQTKKQPKTIR